MATFTWKNAQSSGLWTDGANWVGGVSPNSATDSGALSATGPYTVTIPAGSTITAQGISTVAGVTLDVAGTFVATVPGAFLTLGGGGLLNVGGTLHANGTGTFIFLNNLALANLSGGVLSGGTFAATGQPSGGSVATIEIRRTGQDATITTLDATVVLRHVNSTIQGRDAGGVTRTIDTTLTAIAPGGDLHLLGGRGLAINQALTVSGRLVLEGSKVSSKAGLSVTGGGTVVGNGTISTAVALAGTVRAAGGTLALSGGVSGAGTLAMDSAATLVLPAGTYDASIAGPGILRANAGVVSLAGAVSGAPVLQVAAGATIDLGAAGASTLAFAGSGAKLAIDGAGFSGSIVGFQTGNVLQVKDILATGASVAAVGADSLLTLATAGGTVSFKLSGDYSAKSFAVAPDGGGGTNITVAGVSFVPQPASWGSSTITWSFAKTNFFGSLVSFSSFVDEAAQAGLAAMWRAAFARWAEVSGLTFVEVADAASFDTQADIRVGWGNFGNPPTGEIGEARFSYIGGTSRFVPGTLVRLQDPAITPLVDAGGTLVYQGSVSSAYQVMLHEIGHALGLDHAAAGVDPAALMNPIASDANRDLDISDIAGIQAIYAGRIPAAVTPATTLSIAALAASKPEGQTGTTGFTFTVTRSGDTGTSHTASYAVTGSGANPAAAADFAGGVLPSGTVSFAPGQTSQTLTIPVAGDTAVEADEGFTVTLSAPSTGASLGTATAAGTIINDDATLSIAALAASKPEGQTGTTGFTFTVTRSGDTATAHTASYAVTGSGANPAAAADFAGGVLPGGTISFAPGQTSQTLTIPVTGDTAVEADEGFTVTLSAPSTGASLGTATAAGTIINDDATLSIAALAASKPEGDGGSTGFTFTVTRAGQIDIPASATWTVAGSGAAPASAADFAGGVLPTGSVSFAPGQTTQTVTVPVAGDSTVEADEGFSVTLSAPSGATIAGGPASGTIVNDDAAFSIAALDAVRLEGHAGSTGYSFTITRAGATSGAASVAWAVAGSGASPANGADFPGGVLPGGIASFAPGQTSLAITVPVLGDSAVEPDEGFTVTLSSPVGGTLGTASAAGTILNDDATLSIAALDADRAEGHAGTTGFTFTVSRAGDTTGVHTVAYAVSGASGTDFAGGVLPAGTLTFAPGQTSQLLTIPVAGDTAVEADEGFTVTLSSPSAGATLAGASAAGTIRNDDAALSIAALVATRPEGHSGTTGFTFTVSRTGFTASGASVDWAVSGAAVTGADFHGGALPAGTLSFAPGETSRILTIDVAGDTAVEADEGFAVTLSNPAGATLAAATAAGVILNDDATISIAAAAASLAEGNGGSTGFSFTLTRAGNTLGSATVAYAVTGSGANPADAADFTPAGLPAGTVSFAPGETSRTLTIPVAGDSTVEPDEGFTVTLSAPVGATLGTVAAAATIQNDDVLLPATLSLSRLFAVRSEGQSGATDFTFLVTRTGDTTTEVTALWTTAGGGAGGTMPATGPDFVGGALPSGIVTLAPGQTSAVITIEVAGDTASETNESFTVTLASASPGSSLASANAVGIIYNDDTPGTGTLSIARASASKPEGAAGATPFTFTVTRSGPTTGSASADWSLTPGGIAGTAPIDAADLVGGALPSGRINFAPGETSRTVTVNIAGDGLVEPDESFTVTLSGAQAGVGIATASATGLVQNDDVPGTGTLAIARQHAARAEGQAGATTPFTFLVSRSGDLSGPARASWAVTGGALAGTVAANAADFAGAALPSGTVTFAAGQASQVITVTVAGDSLVELNESFTVTLSAPAPGVDIATATATGVIFNDDTAGTGTLSIARANAQKPEGHAGTTPFTFTVTRTGDASGSASADWAVTGGGVAATVAANAADFPGGVLPNGRVNFAAGQTSQTVTVNVAGDSLIELNDSFTVTLAAPQAGVTLGTASATGVIMNDDFPPSGTLSIAGLHASRGEGAGGATPFTFVVTRSGSAAGPASAAWSIAGGGVGGTVGTNAADFVGGVVPSGTVSLAPGQTSAVITVEIAGDTAAELNESFTVTLSAPPAGVSLGTASATGLVWNDDPAGTGTLSIAGAGQRAEGHDGSTALTFIVSRSGDLSGPAGADWIATGGGAAGTLAANGADFVGGQLPAGRVQFAAGQAMQIITLNVAGDTAAELNESVTVTLFAPQAGVALATASAVGIILNDDYASTAANQVLTGTDSADLFLLGGGLDTVTGRGGTDLFLFQPAAIGPAAANATTLVDFNRAAGEVLNLAAIDANPATPGDDAFVFIGTAPFSGTPGELRWEDQGSQLLIQGNTAGDTAAELTIFVKAAGPVEAGWFVL